MAGSAATLRELALVFLGGGVGAASRVALSASVDRWIGTRLPHAGTLVVNLLGCLAIGVVTSWMPPGTARNAVVGGLLGGFTTYSAFALLKVDLLAQGRWGVLALQVVAHLLVGVLAVLAGARLGASLGAPS